MNTLGETYVAMFRALEKLALARNEDPLVDQASDDPSRFLIDGYTPGGPSDFPADVRLDARLEGERATHVAVLHGGLGPWPARISAEFTRDGDILSVQQTRANVNRAVTRSFRVDMRTCEVSDKREAVDEKSTYEPASRIELEETLKGLNGTLTCLSSVASQPFD